MQKEYKEGETYNMCKAFIELMEDSKMEGRAEGHAEGHADGIRIGIQVLIRENRDMGVSDEVIVEKLCKYYSLSWEDAMEAIKNADSENLG